MNPISINAELCEQCGACVASCPETIFTRADKKTTPETTHEELCLVCGQCVAVCPTSAITHAEIPEKKIKPVKEKSGKEAVSFDALFDLLKTRRSVRAFKKKGVDKETVSEVIKAARYAPSAHNAQSTEFIVVRDGETLEKISALTAEFLTKTAKQLRNPLARKSMQVFSKENIDVALKMVGDFDRISGEAGEGKDTVLFNAPCLLIFHADKDVHFAEMNAALALHNAALACHALGLGAFVAGYVIAACQKDPRIPALISLPAKHRVYGVLAIGHPKFKYPNWIKRKAAKVEWL